MCIRKHFSGYVGFFIVVAFLVVIFIASIYPEIKIFNYMQKNHIAIKNIYDCYKEHWHDETGSGMFYCKQLDKFPEFKKMLQEDK